MNEQFPTLPTDSLPPAAPIEPTPASTPPTFKPQKRGPNWKLIGGVLLLTLTVLGVGAGFTLQSKGQDVRQQASEGNPTKKGLSISGNKILLDGEPFLMKGLITLALVAPKDTKGLDPYVTNARTKYGFKQIEVAKEWGANTLRFHVSQPGLDPQSPLYSQEYVDEVYDKVRLALSKDMVVIIDMQAELSSGATEWTRMPTDQTKRAWSTLAPMFADYPRVMYEVFNEPGLPESPENWDIWLNGGFVPASGGKESTLAANEEAVSLNPENVTTTGGSAFPAVTAIGHQQMVTHIRNAGSKNIIIVDGLFYGRSLNQDKIIVDPLNKIVYAAHVLYGFDKNRVSNMEEVWDTRFGKMSEKYPVMVTAWSAHAFYKAACRDNAQEITERLFAYLKQKKIGLAAWAIDIPGTIVKNDEYEPTLFTNFSCDKLKSGGGGKQLQGFFQTAKP